jgi:hypothetical protein
MQEVGGSDRKPGLGRPIIVVIAGAAALFATIAAYLRRNDFGGSAYDTGRVIGSALGGAMVLTIVGLVILFVLAKLSKRRVRGGSIAVVFLAAFAPGVVLPFAAPSVFMLSASAEKAVMQEFSDEISAQTPAYARKLDINELIAPLQPASLSKGFDVEATRRAVQDFKAANAEFESLLVGAPDRIRARLSKRGVSAEQTEAIVASFKAGFDETNGAASPRLRDEIATITLDLAEFIHRSREKWTASADIITFERDGDLAEYNRLSALLNQKLQALDAGIREDMERSPEAAEEARKNLGSPDAGPAKTR